MIGNGRAVKAWKDKWLPRGPSFRRIMLMDTSDADILVSDFIREDGRSWNEEVLRSKLFLVDVDTILSISAREGQGRLNNWYQSKTGNFTVRSTYNLAKNMDQDRVGNCSMCSKPEVIRMEAIRRKTFLYSLISYGRCVCTSKQSRGENPHL
ncbi:hypothetical protein Salat_2896500 [Sesamum alatum]|uniref:Uncharacterized protein n=1 Tax=Sesamum alatum TaxID=300844 RepID=A0AAE1XIQ3_9LAMI|nr:hypothetical protein Salat_2896500 [Sesamum alatum]